MKVAVIGSRTCCAVQPEKHLPPEVTEIVTGGAKGVDSDAMRYAREHGLKLTLFLPQFERYGRAAPIVRNRELIAYADHVVVFWDGESKGTAFGIREAERLGKPIDIIYV